MKTKVATSISLIVLFFVLVYGAGVPETSNVAFKTDVVCEKSPPEKFTNVGKVTTYTLIVQIFDQGGNSHTEIQTGWIETINGVTTDYRPEGTQIIVLEGFYSPVENLQPLYVDCNGDLWVPPGYGPCEVPHGWISGGKKIEIPDISGRIVITFEVLPDGTGVWYTDTISGNLEVDKVLIIGEIENVNQEKLLEILFACDETLYLKPYTPLLPFGESS